MQKTCFRLNIHLKEIEFWASGELHECKKNKKLKLNFSLGWRWHSNCFGRLWRWRMSVLDLFSRCDTRRDQTQTDRVYGARTAATNRRWTKL